MTASKLKLRERRWRAITGRILAGLRRHGNYSLRVRADINEVARDAGWVVLPDGTAFPSSSHSQNPSCIWEFVLEFWWPSMGTDVLYTQRARDQERSGRSVPASRGVVSSPLAARPISRRAAAVAGPSYSALRSCSSLA
ncbi:uncharacterized protein LOC106866006 [Brachypodium distachyon]|uniref:uncharacterized protein LOC106866006 n=1 Tax=Brachypodium distachyon TaxID=15368 RepID=UPI00071C336E|nr:uncharacterized protein LOC106866006 [Brachypodium distachyon]|eukprot:XP_014753965.1 uncharacterized protein LOC106866006 [Brachypodium distachyon]